MKEWTKTEGLAWMVSGITNGVGGTGRLGMEGLTCIGHIAYNIPCSDNLIINTIWSSFNDLPRAQSLAFSCLSLRCHQ